MAAPTYLPRVSDRVLERRLRAKGAVLVEGAKWCGKTTTCAQQAESVVYLADPATRHQNLALATTAPQILLRGAAPRLIDEWQLAPPLWDAIRAEVDVRQAFGQFILTGSSVPADYEQIAHTGTGRIARVRMRPMSLFESGDSTGEVGLTALFEGERPAGQRAIDIHQLAYLTCRGGWPRAVTVGEADTDVALQQAVDYVEAVTDADVIHVDGVQRSPSLARLIMRALARASATATPLTKIVADVNAREPKGSDKTVADYLTALERIFVVENLTAWNPKLRSKAAIRTKETRHFVDPSIATATLHVGPDGLIADLETFGLIFETLCIRDLRVYADALDAQVSHYRDADGLECDAVIHRKDGAYGLVEIKLGGESAIDQGAASLLKLSQKIDTDTMTEPAFLMVLTGIGEYAYQRPDGVFVCPVSLLGP